MTQTDAHRASRSWEPRSREPRSRDRGMTLIEILIVLAVMAIAALVVLENLNSMYRKFELDSAANELSAFLDRVPTMARQLNQPLFVVWDPANDVVQIASGNPVTNTNLVQQYDFDISLVARPDSSPAAPFTLRCDPMGRTYVGNSIVMMDALRSVTLSHADMEMNGGNITPNIVYTLTISPLWNVTIVKQSQ